MTCIFVFFIFCQAFASETIKIVWTDAEGRYYLNEGYIKSAPAPIKAILAYYSLLGGIECRWDGGGPNDDGSNLNSGLTGALDLGYQGGKKQLDFVNKWFNGRKTQFTEHDCVSALETATSSNRLPFLELTIVGDIVSVRYCYASCFMRDGETRSQWARDYLKVFPDKTVILQKIKFKETYKNFLSRTEA
ncbi:MAG: hypothetical protein PHS37_08485 [Candidatus Omnitrophica bacterium]|nr:hypothetical protein [Candidatus Omnitrophota bacterium]